MEKCIFSLSNVLKCKQPQTELYTAGNDRILKIIETSKQRQDCVNVELEKQLQNEHNVQTVKYHKSCVSTYTSPLHIGRYLRRIGVEQADSKTSSEPPVKRLRRSDVFAFDFKKHCLFCGEPCNIYPDPKTPKRWRKALLCRTSTRPGKKTFKETILDTCKIRNDEWARNVQTRVNGAVSDLHAADGRYHDDCRKHFMGPRNTIYASKDDEPCDIDTSFNDLLIKVRQDKSKIWSSVELHNQYKELEGHLSRPCLMKKLLNELSEDVFVFSSPGLASFLIFKDNASNVFHVEEDDESGLSCDPIANQIVKECRKLVTHKDRYNIRINKDIALEESSPTMLHLLECISEKLNRTLPSLLICSIITSLVRESPTSLQIALGVETREKSKIETLFDFGVTCSYDEIRRFKSSIAKASTHSTDRFDITNSLQPINENNRQLI